MLMATVTSLQSRNELTHWENRPFYGAWPDSQYKKPTGVTKTLKKKRRTRTAFTTEQLHTLEQSFTYSRYINPENRKELARYLNLGERSIKIWFQNRRMKEKRNSSESSSDVSIEESYGITSLTNFDVSSEISSMESSGITSPTDFNVSRENSSVESSEIISPTAFNVSSENSPVEISGTTSPTDFNASSENSSVESAGISSPIDFTVSNENSSVESSGTTSPIDFNEEKEMLNLLKEDIPSIASNQDTQVYSQETEVPVTDLQQFVTPQNLEYQPNYSLTQERMIHNQMYYYNNMYQTEYYPNNCKQEYNINDVNGYQNANYSNVGNSNGYGWVGNYYYC